MTSKTSILNISNFLSPTPPITPSSITKESEWLVESRLTRRASLNDFFSYYVVTFSIYLMSSTLI